MFKKILGVIFPAVLLAACHSSDATKSQTTQTTNAGKTEHFLCNNGLAPIVTFLGNDKLEIRVDHYQALLTLAVSASGERYVSTSGLFGSGGEWHQKGSEAVFTYKGVHGNAAEVSCKLEM